MTWFHIYRPSYCVLPPDRALGASAGDTGSPGRDWGVFESPVTTPAPPGGRYMLLAAESSTSSRPDTAGAAAAGTEFGRHTEI